MAHVGFGVTLYECLCWNIYIYNKLYTHRRFELANRRGFCKPKNSSLRISVQLFKAVFMSILCPVSFIYRATDEHSVLLPKFTGATIYYSILCQIYIFPFTIITLFIWNFSWSYINFHIKYFDEFIWFKYTTQIHHISSSIPSSDCFY